MANSRRRTVLEARPEAVPGSVDLRLSQRVPHRRITGRRFSTGRRGHRRPPSSSLRRGPARTPTAARPRLRAALRQTRRHGCLHALRATPCHARRIPLLGLRAHSAEVVAAANPLPVHRDRRRLRVRAVPRRTRSPRRRRHAPHRTPPRRVSRLRPHRTRRCAGSRRHPHPPVLRDRLRAPPRSTGQFTRYVARRSRSSSRTAAASSNSRFLAWSYIFDWSSSSSLPSAFGSASTTRGARCGPT